MTDLLDQNGNGIRNLKNIKDSIVAIEQFVFVLGNVTVISKQAEAFIKGVSMLQRMHDQLLAQMTPEEVEEFKKELNAPQNKNGAIN